MGTARKPRSDCKVYRLPKNIFDELNERLFKRNMSYADTALWLAEHGYKVSKSSLNRYYKVKQNAAAGEQKYWLLR